MVFKDVYREVGMLEVFVTCLSRYAVFLKDKQLLEEEKLKESQSESPSDSPIPPDRKKRLSKLDSLLISDNKAANEHETLGFYVLEGLQALLNGNANNCTVFRDIGGAKCVHGIVVHDSCRRAALGEWENFINGRNLLCE